MTEKKQTGTKATDPGTDLAVRTSNWLTNQERVVNDYLPRGMDTRAFLAGASLAIGDSPELQRALQSEEGRRTLVSALCRAARVGLSLNPQDHESGIIAFKGRIQYMVFAQGLVADAIRSGAVKEIRSMVVYTADKLSLGSTEEGDTYTLETGLDDRGPIRGFLAVARLNDNTIRTHYMSEPQAREWGKRYGQPGPMWTHSFEGAGQKTVVRQLLTKLHVRTVEDILEAAPEEAPPVTVVSEPGAKGTSADDLVRTLEDRSEDDPPTDTGDDGELPFGPAGR